ncbi:hypothetical protein [Seonamhaeicola maritimus]|uniref:Uncharacterized protein n=1 Tax=Seonamhaeicola maritimus TaxID=2591822 RepID=A0A5C7GFV0_9FLAO|nr:hypothetical protein [Seonamhaeicola maritimus]TXG35755.1 hypothetical protein FUA22_14765 [Seonamhaeicola maritimus]
MQTNYLLPNKHKTSGWIILLIGLISGTYIWFTDYESDYLTIKVFTILSDDQIFDSSREIFKIIENSIVDELAALAIIIGGIIVGFSKEKIEDEFIYKLRKDSLVWAIIFNYVVLALTIIFVYNFSFFHILVFNMFTPLLFFIIRFNFLKHKTRSHEE